MSKKYIVLVKVETVSGEPLGQVFQMIASSEDEVKSKVDEKFRPRRHRIISIEEIKND